LRTLVIWGCGGHGRVVFDIATAMGVFGGIWFYDDRPDAAATVAGTAVLTGSIGSAAPEGAEFVIAIGDNRVRAAKFAEALGAGLRPAICGHPTACISPSAVVGAGTVLMPFAVVQAGARVGLNCILNTCAVVEHDCVIGDHAHLSPSAVLGGNVQVGEFAHMGIGTVARPGARVGAHAVVGAGAVVLDKVEPNTTVAGVPARELKR
jgi:sugar O-acyltransferase (sialic acid O-acetyltransferase NeuD family)